MKTFVLPAALRAQIATEARTAWPHESCGLIEGTRGEGSITATMVHPVRNAARQADRFEIDPAEHFRKLRAARARGQAIIGCYHSHPNGKAEPSARDQEGAGEVGFVWLITALTADATTELRAFLFDGPDFAPIRIGS